MGAGLSRSQYPLLHLLVSKTRTSKRALLLYLPTYPTKAFLSTYSYPINAIPTSKIPIHQLRNHLRTQSKPNVYEKG